jgi:hypothetical protein
MTIAGPGKDWLEWHSSYDRPGSSLAVRLSLVQGHLRTALEAAPPGEIRLVSMCAGQGRDVIGALTRNRRRADVRARLVELDERNAGLARELADGADLPQVEVVTGDASVSDAYVGAAPAHIVLVCGVFGNISNDDIRRTISLVPMLCESGATVLWTRHRREPDLTPQVRSWFAECGYEELARDEPPDLPYIGVGAHRWPGERGVVEEGVGFFRFVDDPRPAP